MSETVRPKGHHARVGFAQLVQASTKAAAGAFKFDAGEGLIRCLGWGPRKTGRYKKLVVVPVFTHLLRISLRSSPVVRMANLVDNNFDQLRVVAVKLTHQIFGRNREH